MLSRGRDTVASVLAGHAARTPDAPFLVTQGASGIEIRTYADTQARSPVSASARVTGSAST